MSHMDPDLVRAAGFQPTFHIGIATETLQYFHMGDGLFACRRLYHSHSFPISRIPSDITLNCQSILWNDTITNSLITAYDSMRTELFGDRTVCGIIFTHDDGTSCILIDPVYDSGTKNSVDSAQRAMAMVENSIDEGAIRMAGRRMNDHVFGLIHDKDIVVLIQNVKRNILRDRYGKNLIWNSQMNAVIFTNAVTGFWRRRFQIDGNSTFFQQLLKITAGLIRTKISQKAVKSGPFFLFRHQKVIGIHNFTGLASKNQNHDPPDKQRGSKQSAIQSRS